MRKTRRPFLLLTLCAAALAAGPSTRAADAPTPEIVVAMRYLQQDGESHAHLYLYRADGKLLRQLTDDDTGQDYAPAFAPDGETIVFARRKDAGGTDYFSVGTPGGKPSRLAAAPPWYLELKEAPEFNYLNEDPDQMRLFTQDEDNGSGKPTLPKGPPPVHRAPDGSVELVLKLSSDNDKDDFNGEGHGKSYELRDRKSGKTFKLGQLPGFVGLVNLMALGGDKDARFLLAPPLRVAFFALHLDSTDGDTDFALDLDGKKLVRLSPNWATPIPLPGEAAFLTITENRYVPFGDGKRTAICSYVERWDGEFKPVRFAPEKAAGICYGASMYRPGKIPAVVRIKGEPVPEPGDSSK